MAYTKVDRVYSINLGLHDRTNRCDVYVYLYSIHRLCKSNVREYTLLA